MTKSQTETYHNKLDEQTNERKQNLQRLWSAYYYKFRFSDDIFTELVKNYDRKHIVVIEEMLKECTTAVITAYILMVISLMCIQAAGNR